MLNFVWTIRITLIIGGFPDKIVGKKKKCEIKNYEKSEFSISKSGFLEKIKFFFVIVVVCNDFLLIFVPSNLKQVNYE